MKKIIALSLFAMFVAFSSYGYCATIDQQKESGFISVSANTSEEMEPNQAVVTFAVEEQGKTMPEANEKINALSTKLSEVVKIKMLETDTIKTTNHQVKPIYRYNQRDKKQILIGYKATNTMVVTTKNLEQLPAMISLALTNGATEVRGLNFSLTDYNAKCNELIGEATKRTYDNASFIAKSVGSSLNGVKNINAYCGTQSQSRAFGVMLKTANAVESTADEDAPAAPKTVPAIEPGTIKVNANVDASFYVK